MTPALVLAFALMTAAPPADTGGGEPLPPGAPTDSYELAAWCYGALDEYLHIYQRVIPDLKAIDAEFGPPDNEPEPYAHDMAAYRVELKMIGDAVTDAEKASPEPIAPRGAAALEQGRAIWSIAETKPHRELARAWMFWALPDRCDSNARALAARSLLLGKALKYNAGPTANGAAAAKASPRRSASALDAPADAAPPPDPTSADPAQDPKP